MVMMIDFVSIYDAFFATVVFVFICLVISFAWLSTQVRHHQLVATAYFVLERTENIASTTTNVDSSQVSENVPVATQNNTSSEMMNEVNSELTAEIESSVEANIMPDSKIETEEASSENGERIMQDSATGATDGGACQSVVSLMDADMMENCVRQRTLNSSRIADDVPQQNQHVLTADLLLAGNLPLVMDDMPSPEPAILQSSLDKSSSELDTSPSETDISPSETNISPSETDISPSEAVNISTPDSNISPSEFINISEPDPDSIRVRLKFLDDTLKLVYTTPHELLGHFKRRHFSAEMSTNCRVRLIFNGQLLTQDSLTISHCGIFDNCVIHCHVSQPQVNAEESFNVARVQEEALVSGLMGPLFFCLLAFMWYLRYQFSHIFNLVSTLILVCLTAMLLVSVYLSHFRQPNAAMPSDVTSHSDNNNQTR